MAGWPAHKLRPPRIGEVASLGALAADAKSSAPAPAPAPTAAASAPGAGAAGVALPAVELRQHLERFTQEEDAVIPEKDNAAAEVVQTLCKIMADMGLKGEAQAFGSFTNGFRRGGSDLDISFLTQSEDVQHDATPILHALLKRLPERFTNVSKVFIATTPLLKFIDEPSGMDIDLCINNRLGVRNSLLLQTYCQYDRRVRLLGRLVKDWAKAHRLVGSADGYLNSYAYMLMVLHYLQQCSPPVVPNLQALSKKSVPITDSKWGCEDIWETKFLAGVDKLPPSQNAAELGDLIVGFFHFYSVAFDWSEYAVCIRLNRHGIAVDKYSLCTPTSKEAWYIEDPFDLKHNLAGKCSVAARRRILERMRASYDELRATGHWAAACPPREEEVFLLKCRISLGVTAQKMLECFEGFGLRKLYFPKPDNTGRLGQAFLEFDSAADRRYAHTRNETILGDCQICLIETTQEALAEALVANAYSRHDGEA